MKKCMDFCVLKIPSYVPTIIQFIPFWLEIEIQCKYSRLDYFQGQIHRQLLAR